MLFVGQSRGRSDDVSGAADTPHLSPSAAWGHLLPSLRREARWASRRSSHNWDRHLWV